MIAAILRAQLLTMRPRSGSMGLGLLVTVFWYGFWCFAACWAGLYVAVSDLATLRFSLPIGLMGVCIYWQAMPVLSASMGAGLDLRKLLLYPVPHQNLFAVELLLRLVAGAEMILVLLGGGAGLIFNRAGGVKAVSGVAATLAFFVLFNVLLASGTRSLMERLLSRRKVRELVALLLAVLWVGPRLMMMRGVEPKWLHRGGDAVGAFGWPWSAAAHGLLSWGESGGMLLLSALSLAVWTLAAGWFGRTQFERNIRYDVLAAQAIPQGPAGTAARSWTGWFYRLPAMLWRDPLAAIVEKELRTLARSPRFRMAFVMGLAFGMMAWLPMIMGRRAAHSGFFADSFLTVVCVYAMSLIGQVTYWNSFGLDRSAAIFYFTAPQPISRTLIGKNIACLFYIYLETLVLTAITLAVRVNFGLKQLAETLAVVGICAVYLMGLGNMTSVRYPIALSPERVSQGGGGHKAQVLVMVFYPVALLPVVLAYIARYALESELAFAAVLGLAAAIGAMLYWIAMESAVQAASKLRQNLVAELSKGEGPVAT
jgi:ABC-2 type transport system permease protein